MQVNRFKHGVAGNKTRRGRSTGTVASVASTPDRTTLGAVATVAGPGRPPSIVRSVWNARLLVPHDGAYLEQLRRPCDFPRLLQERSDGAAVYDTSEDAVRCYDRHGAVRFEHRLAPGERVGQTLLDEKRDRLYLRTGRAVRVLRASDGQSLGEKQWDDESFARRIALLPDGGVLCTDYDHICKIDATTSPPREVWRSSSGLRPERVEVLAGGETIMLVEDNYPGYVRLLGPDGSVRQDVERVQAGSVRVDAQGQVWLATRRKSADGWRDEDTEVQRLDPRTGKSETLTATFATDGVLPLRDGRYLALHRYVEKPRFILFDKDQRQECSFSLQDDDSYRRHTLRHVLLADDESALYVLVQREGFDYKKEQLLIRVDLSKPHPPVQKDGYTQTASEAGDIVWRKPGDDAGVPQVPGTKRIAFGFYTDPIEEGPPSSSFLDARDGTLRFTLPDAVRDAVAAGTESDLLPFALRKEARLTFPSGASVAVTRDEVRAADRIYHPGGGQYAAVGLFEAGDRKFVVTATEDGLIEWHEPGDVDYHEQPVRFDLGAPPQSIRRLDERTIRVTGNDGRMLLLQPPLHGDETLLGRGPSSAGPPAPTVRVDGNEVVIGSLRLPRRT
jgi:hypothetical protein